MFGKLQLESALAQLPKHNGFKSWMRHFLAHNFFWQVIPSHCSGKLGLQLNPAGPQTPFIAFKLQML